MLAWLSNMNFQQKQHDKFAIWSTGLVFGRSMMRDTRFGNRAKEVVCFGVLETQEVERRSCRR